MFSSKKAITVMGLMSGTSMDGIDATLIKTDGKKVFEHHPMINNNYSKDTQEMLLTSFNTLIDFLNNKSAQEELIYKITIDHFRAAKVLINKTNIIPDLIGFHGQTIYHNPKQKKSIQLGNAELLSKLLKIDVISDFRENDIYNGGEGAPLAPIYHKYLIKKHNFSLPTCFLNIGGISNISYYDGRDLIGFDAGPGNGLMDQYIQSISKYKYDNNGKIASNGKSHESYIKIFKKNSFFSKNYPKSLDRQDFSKIFNSLGSAKLSVEDKMATLAELTIEAIRMSINILPYEPKNIILVGGGSKNTYLVNRLKKIFCKKLYTYDELGYLSQRVEADLIAYLAARSKYKYPISYPKTTGVKKPLTGGRKIEYTKL